MARGMDPAKVEQWTACLARFPDAGLTVAKFCESEGVSPPSFYQWRRKLAAMGEMQQEKDATGTRSSHRSRSGSAFQAVEVLSAITSAATIRFPGGVEIEMGGDLRAFDLLLGRLLNGAASDKDDRPC